MTISEKIDTTPQKLDNHSAGKIIEVISPYLDNIHLVAEFTDVYARQVPFYKSYKLFSFTDRTKFPAESHFVLYRPGHVQPLDWGHHAIYEANKIAPIFLTKDNVADYVRFFFALVRNKVERIHLVEKIADVPFITEPEEHVNEQIKSLIQPLFIDKDSSKTNFELSATVMFRDGLFSTSIGVRLDGRVQIYNQTLLMEHLPAHADASHLVANAWTNPLEALANKKSSLK